MKTKQRNVLYVQKLPDQLKADFKAAVAKRGKTMRAVVIELLMRYIAASPK